MEAPAKALPVVRILVCASTRVYREGLVDRLEDLPEFRVVGSSRTGFDCIEMNERAAPDVVLLDVGAAGAETAMNVLTRMASGTRIVALAMPSVEAEVVGWVKRGAAGFVTAEDSLDDLVATLRAVARGEGRCSPRMIAALVRSVHALAVERALDGRRPAVEPLTARELEIGVLLERGLTNRQIATRLSIELPTVKNHLHSMFTKLHVAGRVEAGSRLRALGLAPRPQD